MNAFDLDLNEARLRRLINPRDVHRRYRAILDTTSHGELREALVRSVEDIPWLLADLDRAWELVDALRMQYANLLAACRAAIAAQHDGEADPLAHVRDELPPQRRRDRPRVTWAGPVHEPPEPPEGEA